MRYSRSSISSVRGGRWPIVWSCRREPGETCAKSIRAPATESCAHSSGSRPSHARQEPGSSRAAMNCGVSASATIGSCTRFATAFWSYWWSVSPTAARYTGERPRVKGAIGVEARAGAGDTELIENEWSRACNPRDRYCLYVVYECATPNPRLLRVWIRSESSLPRPGVA
jgi:hypothetical protein